MTLELTPQERDLLVGLLDREISDLGPEIHHTDTRSFRQDLKATRQLLLHLRDRLAEHTTPAEHVTI